MRSRFLAAIALIVVTGAIGSGSTSAPGVPAHVPGRTLPVVRQHTYRMAGKIRVLLLWVGRDDVGSGVIKWRGGGDEKAIEILIGSDPNRAPSQLNKWGYLVEAMRGDESSVVGLISQENDDRLSDVKADLKTRNEQRAFDTIRGFAAQVEGMARVGTLYAPSHLTYHDADTVLSSVLGDSSLPVKRVARRGNVRPGFLTSLTELIRSSLDANNLSGDPIRESGCRPRRRVRQFWAACRPQVLSMRVHLINPSDISFGTAVITPRWLYVLAAATPSPYGDPRIVDETLDPIDFDSIDQGDVVGIGIHTFNALRGYEIGRQARQRGATVVFGGVHPTLYPEECFDLGGAHAAVKGDGDLIWARVLADHMSGQLQRVYDGGRVGGGVFKSARWDLLPADRYMWASVQTLRGCPKHCSFCSVWRTDGQQPRQRTADAVVQEVVDLRRKGFRFILLSDDNFYPVTVEDLRLAERQGNQPGSTTCSRFAASASS